MQLFSVKFRLSLAFLLGVCSLSLAAQAQELTKDLAKIKEQIRVADYKEALQRIDKIQAKIEKKKLPPTLDQARLYILESYAMAGFAHYYEAQLTLNKGIEIYKKLQPKPTQELFEFYLDGAEIFNDYGFFVLSHELAGQAQDVLDDLGSIDSLHGRRIFEAKLVNDLMTGHLNESASRVEDLIRFRQKMVAAPMPAGKVKEKDIRKEREEALFRARYYKGLSYFMRGDQNNGEKYLEKLYDEARDALGKGDPITLQIQITWADLLADHRKFDEAYSLYNKALGQMGSSKNYHRGHRNYLHCLEQVCRTGYPAKEVKKASLAADRYEQIVEEYFEWEPEYHSVAVMLKTYELESLGKLNEALVDMYDVYRTKIKYLPFSPEKRLKVLDHFYQYIIELDSIDLAGKIRDEQLEIKRANFGLNSPEYHRSKLDVTYFRAMYRNQWQQAEDIFERSWEKIVRPQLSNQHNRYIDYLNMEAKVFELNDKFSPSKVQLEAARSLVEKKYTKESTAYGQQLERLANLLVQTGDYRGAEENLSQAVELIRDLEGRQSQEYVNVLRSLARFYSVVGLYEEAEEVYAMSFKLQNKLYGSVSIYGQTATEDVANLYYLEGQYAKSGEMLRQIIALKEEFGTDNYELIRPLILLADVELETGNFTEAERQAARAAAIAKKVFSDTSLKYFQAQTTLARVYKAMGDFDRAQKLSIANEKALIKKFGVNHYEVAEAKTDLALVLYQNNGKMEDVTRLLEEARDIIRTALGEAHPAYAKALKNLAFLQIDQKRLAEAASLLEKSEDIYEKKLGAKNAAIAEIQMLQGDLAHKRGKLNDAAKYYIRSADIYRGLFGKEHPQYVRVLGRLARVEYSLGDKNKAIKMLEESTDIYLKFITDYFPSLSDREKTKYWNLIRSDFELYNTVAVKYGEQKPDLIGKMFDFQLATKAILLSSSVKVRNRILNSGDAVLIGNYKTWLAKKELLTQLTGMTPEALKESGEDPIKLSQDIEQLEKRLNEESEDFASANEYKALTWRDVAKALKPNEYVVEMIRYRHFDQTFTDSAIYAALIVHAETKKAPQLVLMPYGNRMEGRDLKFYRNSIRNFNTDDKRSYGAFWEPIKKYIPDGATVYLSPDGIYSQVNLETLLAPDGSFVIDKNTLVLVSNAKDLVLRNQPTKKKVEASNVAALFGNPSYYKGTLTSQRKADLQEAETLVDALPGTDVEIKEISGILAKNKWNTQVYTESLAAEDRVKAIENPRVFHIATHGFFLDDKQMEEDNLGLKGSNELQQNVLLRSGILLAESGEILAKKANVNAQNGILTAYEALNLNLDATELVVLSACETGLGVQQVGEGVYGLQRSLQVAGAKNVVMSLFKVDDAATQKLMVRFYNEWLKTGNKREAFRTAKQELKKEYPQPLYWGSFVMLGI